MSLATEFRLYQASLEIQYLRGVVYLDRCGSLMLRLQDALGAPRFEGSVPVMQFGELRNDAERIAIRYGPASFAVTQTWMPSPARFEQLGPLGWEVVAKALEIGDQVTRFGVRFWLVWKADSLPEGIASVERSGLGRCPPLIGDSPAQSFNALVRDRLGDLRIMLDAVLVIPREEMVPKALGDVPRYAVQLDLDHVYPGSWDPRAPKDDQSPFALSRAQVKDFVRASWQRTRELGAKMRPLLGGE